MVRVSDLGCSLFADDAVLTHCHSSIKQLERHFNTEVRKLHHWFIANKLTLNLSKTKFMVFSKLRKKKAKEKKFKININNYSIKQVNEMKYLGVILDTKLNWHNHIQYICSKLSKGAGIIYKLKNKVPQSVLLLLYNSLVDTYLRYGITSWGSAKTTALAKLQNFQNKIVRYITHSSPLTDVTPHFKRLNILKIKDLHFLEVSKFMYRNTKHDLPSSFDEYFRHIDHHHYTIARDRNTFTLPSPRTDFGKQSIKYLGIQIWSALPEDIRNAPNIESFNSMVKSFLIKA